MNQGRVILLLLVAAILEAGGDAIIRHGLHGSSLWHRIALFVFGGAVLFAYGYAVNAPPWDFGRLLGLYVVFFFVIAQILSTFVFGQPPSRSVLIGGAMIVGGGVVISLFQ
jgi:small multidrug resistance family-3 protein